MSARTRKIIFWSVIIALSVGLFFWWIKNAQKTINNFRGKEFIERLNFPDLKMPNAGIPEAELGDTIKELEEAIKNAEEASTTTE